ncbi:MAG TPA: type II secretion system protein N [Pseudomonadales bacterium]|nr:type II secretion system protein N [Pseudomonadales bacterium]
MAVVITVLAGFSWQIVGLRAVQRGDFIDENALKLRSAGAREVGMGLEQVAALHVFGDVAANVVAPPPPADLPKTDLKLVLVGAITDSDPKKASALIQADTQTRRFYIGDNIPGGAVLHEVLSDSVVLERDGRYETLFFPKTSETPAPIKSGIGANPPATRLGSAGVVGTPAITQPILKQDPALRERLQRGPTTVQSFPDER